MTDNSKTPAWCSATVGHGVAFTCGRCHARKRDTVGRRMQRVLGLRTWVCAQCVLPKKEPT